MAQKYDYLQDEVTSNRCPLLWQHDISPETLIGWHFFVSIHIRIQALHVLEPCDLNPRDTLLALKPVHLPTMSN